MQTAPKPLTARVEDHKGRPTLFVNDEPVLPYFYALTDAPPSCWTRDEVAQRNLREFAERGVRLFRSTCSSNTSGRRRTSSTSNPCASRCGACSTLAPTPR